MSGWDSTDGGVAVDTGNSWDHGGASGSGNNFGGGFGTADSGFGGGFGDDAGGNAGHNEGACFNCGEQGHSKADCTAPRVFTGECRRCGKEGHMSKQCPDAPTGPQKCYNCGEEDHVTRDCEQPRICKECSEEGHTSQECPNKVCKNCKQPGHEIAACESARAVNRDDYPTMSGTDAWAQVKAAVMDREIDDIKAAIQTYVKALPETTYSELEESFRAQKIGLFLIAIEKPLATTLTNMDLQGNLGKTYTVTYRFSAQPSRPREREGWPSPEENQERLKDAGDIVPRGVPKCRNCDELGHVAKNCPQEKMEADVVRSVKCYNCDQEGHRVRDCPEARPDKSAKFACHNCGNPDHKASDCTEHPDTSNVECRKCQQMGHFSKDCPSGGGPRVCFNCGEEGHGKSECTNERKTQCRNCDEWGHMSKECPKPRDWSRVTCSNCQEKGHTKVRCKNPPKEEESTDPSDGFPNNGGFDNTGGFDNATASSGWETGGGSAIAAGGAGGGDAW